MFTIYRFTYKRREAIESHITYTTYVARIGVLAPQHLPNAVFVAVSVTFILWQIVQVTAIVGFRATIVGFRVDGSTTEALIDSQWTATLSFIADLSSGSMNDDYGHQKNTFPNDQTGITLSNHRQIANCANVFPCRNCLSFILLTVNEHRG